MRLYYFPVAPNPTKVRLYLAEKAAGGASIPLEQVLVDMRSGAQRSAEHLARNPAGKLPALELEDGSFLTESLAMIEYLEERFPEPPMIGIGLEERARQRELERIAELGVLGSVARLVHATNSPLGLPPNPGVAEQARADLPLALGRLDAVLADGRPFLAGARVGVCDCTLAAALQFARFGGVAIEAAFTNVSAWDARYRARPELAEVLIA
jgi:glutathione S-transferase